MEALQPVDQHWAILLLQDIPAHLDDVVLGNANHVSVERRVVESAERNAIPD